MKKLLLLTLLIPALWLGHRTDVDIGRVLNDQGDGKLYNGESYYNYIWYPPEYHTNDIVMTICFMNPLNNECDDILIRHDVRLLENI